MWMVALESAHALSSFPSLNQENWFVVVVTGRDVAVIVVVIVVILLVEREL